MTFKKPTKNTRHSDTFKMYKKPSTDRGAEHSFSFFVDCAGEVLSSMSDTISQLHKDINQLKEEISKVDEDMSKSLLPSPHSLKKDAIRS